MPLTPADVIASSIETGRQAVHRFVADLTPAEMLHRTAPGANCAAWLVGHLALIDRRVAGMLGATLPPLPTGDFEQRFSQADGAPAAEGFGDVSVIAPAFDAARLALIEAVKSAPPGALDAPLPKPGPMGVATVGEMVNFMGVHAAMHAGQITMIRRSLGKPALF